MGSAVSDEPGHQIECRRDRPVFTGSHDGDAGHEHGRLTDNLLDASVKDFVRQCYPVARVSPAYGVDDDQLFRASTDLSTAFAAMAGPSTFSTVFTAFDKGGTTVSCQEVWTHVADRLSDLSIFESYSAQVCARTGYDIAKPINSRAVAAILGKWAT